jgi:signal transduction histidine kinase/CheY-like chemotaxis protein
MHPDDVQAARDNVHKAVNEKADFNIEYRTIWPDKSVHWIKAVGHVYCDESGEPERMIGVNYDITKQKESAYSLEESKYLLAASLNSMDVGVFITDANGRIIEYNERFSTFFNFSPTPEDTKKEINLHDYLEAYTIAGEIIAPDEWAVPSALRGEIAKNKECILKRKDTGISYICSYCYAPLYQNGQIMGAVVSVIDITTQKQVEEALNKSHDLLLNLARLVPGVIYQYRMYPDGRSAFPYSSPGMYDIYELTPDEVKEDATPVFGRLHPEDYDNIVNKIMHSAETLEIFYCEFRVILPQKGLQWRWSQAHPERMDDGGTLWHGIISDITERKEAEILLRKKSEEIEAQNVEYQQLNDKLLHTNEKLKEAKELAEQSDKLKTIFLQNMSHEIRTPMNAIMGFAELLGKNFQDKERTEKYVKIIKQRCHDLLEIITEILDFAKIESGQLPLMVHDCKINALFFDLQEFLSEYQQRQCKEHIKLDFKPVTNLPGDTIRTDSVKLKQILINLIANAFKFTNKGSIVVECNVEGKSLLFSVADTGIGIPDEKKEFIFERFAQLEPQPGHVYGGTGLGLSIVKGLVNMLGGKVWLESEVGKGTTFYFSLPLYYPEEVLISKYPEEVDNYAFPDKTILIVEDDLCNAEYLKESLRETGAKLLHTEYGKEAVNIATTSKVDLILMDIRLPDIDGYIASKLIKQSNPDIIIISQTAYAAYEDREKSLNAGCDDYISKPAKQEALLAIIKKYFAD